MNTMQLGRLFERIDRRGATELPLLGVSVASGVRERWSGDGRPAAALDLSDYKIVEPGDIIMNALGKPHGSIGRSTVHGITSPAYWILRTTPGLNSRFAHHLLRSSWAVSRFQGLGKNLPPSQFDIPWEIFRKIEVSLPSVTEQRRIADFLDERVARIDQIIAARISQLKELETLFVSRRYDAVLGLKTGATIPTPLPWAPVTGASWHLRRLSQLAQMGTGHTPSRNVPEYWEKCTIPWLTTSDVHRFRHDEIDAIRATSLLINEMGLANSAAVLHSAGTVALSRTASAGFSVIMETDMATSQDFVTWTPGTDLRSEYLLQILRAMRPFLLGNLAMGSTHKTIYFPDLMDLRIPVPDLRTQDQVVISVQEAAQGHHACSRAIRRQLDLLNEYKQSLITAAVTGEFDVTTASTKIPGE